MSIYTNFRNIFVNTFKASLSRSYIIFVVIITTIILGIIIAASILVYNAQEEHRNKALKTTTQLIESELSQIFGNVYRNAQFIGNKISYPNKHSLENITYLFSRDFAIDINLTKNELPQWATFGWINNNGYKVVESSAGILKQPEKIIDKPYLYKSKTFPSILHFGKISVHPKTYEPVIPAALGIINDYHNYLGTITTSFYINNIYDRVSRVLLSSPASFIIISDNDEIIKPESIHFTEAEKEAILSFNKGNQSQPLLIGNSVYSYTKPMSDYPFTILTGYQENIALLQLRETLQINIIILCIVGMLAFVMLRAFYHRGIIPIVKLSEVADKKAYSIASGKHNDIPPESIDKIIEDKPTEIQKIGLNVKSVLNLMLELRNARDETEKSRMAKEQFLSTIRHEFRDSINAAIVSTDILKSYFNKDNNIDLTNITQIKLFETLSTSLNEAANMTRYILNPSDVNIKDVIQDCITIKQQAAFKRKIDIKTQLASQIPSIHTDDRRIKQIILSLLHHAIEGTPKEGTIALKAELSYKGNTANALILTVKDNGHGVSENDWNQIIGDVERVSDGTNLSLTEIRALISLLGGELTIENVWTQGTIYTLLVPFKLDAPRAPRKTSKTLPKNVTSISDFRKKK